ncbi:UDP-Glycosyltransferase/glycogen phosphorylase [Tothia fuscella]|uniref:UDP-Glycosyltransferase/glycogen phosphorylase n=1 Tax=Tothia fuscella TaxID=1048955 RepID=A0A9P4TRM0_9PEZI|nr:UDP-Glycosyltransferase/glycogen phosphorylase [Tothia fuscella]
MAEVILDREGRAIVPTIIPPETSFPSLDHPLPSSSAASLRQNTTGGTSSASTIIADSDNVPIPPKQIRAIHDVPGEPTNRPSLGPKNATEAPRRAPRAPLAGLRSATYQRPPPSRIVSHGLSDSDSDSSSSSDDDVWAQRRRKGNKIAKAHPKKDGRRKSSTANYSRFNVGNEDFSTKGKVDKRDGRLNISVNETANSGYLAKALGAGIKHHFSREHAEKEEDVAALADGEVNMENDKIVEDDWARPRLNIVVIVIGSRGDIQPFLKIGKILKNDYGHRVRIATHPAFKDFVEKDSGLEFFSVGGDPSELMAFMVKNPGLIPSLDTVKAGEIGRRRASMYDMFQGMWRACINATDDETDKANMRMMGDKTPFVADAIIANPPSFAHYHIAERLGIPLHMMFTFPYSPTIQFPHPLANIKRTNADYNYTNFMSYPLVELMTWQGLGDLVNKFRVKSLGLEPVSTLWAPGQLYRLKVPYTYMWSPSLVPKPGDWGPEIDIAGFVFLELADSFKPPESLTQFLDAGPPPVYIGFGSIVVDDPDEFTKMIIEAVKLSGVRALVSKGWGGLGGDDMDLPENIYMLDNTPHDWLFPKMAAVVHHGGAGTTAIGLKCGKPTMIVPFFGDQPFWGAMVSKARAGAFECIPYKKLTAEKLAKGIKECLTEEAQENVSKIAESIEKEGDGAVNAVKSFHRSLPLQGERSMRCSVLDNRVAVWQMKNTTLRLSALAADILVEQKKIKWQDLRLIRHYDWNDFAGPGEPLTGAGAAFIGTLASAGKGVGSIPGRMAKSIKKRKRHEMKVKRSLRQKETKAENKEHEETLHEKGRDKANGVKPRPPGPERGETDLSALSADPPENMAEQLAVDAGDGLVQTGAAIAKAPMNLSLAVARGFHNAPRLYGDETVRTPIRISGFKSGVKAGRDEFVYGIYDGFTGVVRLPYKGAKEKGVLGCLDGFGMGVGGLVLKNIAAFFGPFAYVSKGIHKELQKSRQPTAFLRKARIVQGSKEIKALKDSDQGIAKSAFDTVYWPREGETMKSIEEKVEHGWRIVVEVLDDAEKKKNQGLISGRLAFKKERQKWRENSALESVGTAEKALNAKKEGRDVDDVFEEHKKDVAKSKLPRAPAMEKEKLENGAVGGTQKGLKPDGRVREKADSGLEDGKSEQGKSNDDVERRKESSTTDVADFANTRRTSA